MVGFKKKKTNNKQTNKQTNNNNNNNNNKTTKNKTVTHAKILPQMVNPRVIAGNTEENEE